MYIGTYRTVGYALVLAAAVTMAACGKGGGNKGGGSSGTALSGVVSAPGGTVAMIAPTGLQRLYAAIFGAQAVASLPGDSPVAGATVKLIEINASGTQVGPDIATTTTDASGNYTLVAPTGFTPSPQYVVRVVGSTTTLDTLVTGTASQDVNAATNAGKTLILGTVGSSGNLAALNAGQITSVTAAIADMVKDIDPASTGTPALLSTALATEAQNQEEVNNQVQCVAGTSTLNGTVTLGSTPLANIKIVVRDHGNWVTRATTLTDASGNYSLNLPAGDYIIGAMNYTASSMAASAWWTSSCTSLCTENNQFSAARVTVGAGATSRSFILNSGSRISGAITTSSGGAALAGITVVVRDFSNDMPVAFVRTKTDGTFRVNVKPGTYTVGARNTTVQAYASGLYNGATTGGSVTGGGKSSAQATPVALGTAGLSRTVNFALIDGYQIAGNVTDGVGGSAVTGTAVRFYGGDNTDASTYGAFVDGVRTNLAGSYRLWLQPGLYAARNRGQSLSANISAADSTQNFTAQVGRVTLTLHDGGGNPVSQAKVGVYDTASNYLGFEASNGDGTVDLYSATTGNHLVDLKMDGGQAPGSSIYLNQTQLALGTNVAFTVGSTTAIDGGATAYPVVTLPAGGVLSGTVTKTGVAVANYLVQARSGGTAGTNRFVVTRTQSDGSYTVSLPAGTYALRACDPTNCAGVGTTVTNVGVTAGSPTTSNIAVP